MKQGGKVIDSSASPREAFRAYLIFLAHERNNGRKGDDLTMHPQVSCFLDEVYPSLPSWAEEALGRDYLNTLRRPP